MRALRAWLITDPLIVLATIFYGSVSLLISFCDASGRRQAAIAAAWSRALLAISRVKVRVEGLDRIERGGSYVFASNHVSYMDTPVVLANIPVQFRFLAKKGLFKVPFLGTHLARAGHIPVYRGDPRASVRTLGLAADTIQTRHTSLLVFPEGGRSRTGVLGEFKDGAAYIAIRARVPIVPLALAGTRAVLPFGSASVQPGVVQMRVGEPIPTAELKMHDRAELTQKIREQIAAMLEVETIHA